ncbi:MAG: hypothetical protein ABIK48_06430 [candidate division WOR-3 bacterium]
MNLFLTISDPLPPIWSSSSEGKGFKQSGWSWFVGFRATIGLTYNFNNYRFQRRRSLEIEQELQRENTD